MAAGPLRCTAVKRIVRLDGPMPEPKPDRPTRARLQAAGGQGGRTSRKRLDYLTRTLVIRLRQAEPDRSIASIADVVGCSEPSARRILQAHTSDAKSLVRDLLVTGTLDRLDDWARASRVSSDKGYHHGAMEWLQAAELIDRKAPAPAVSVDNRPTIVVNIPFQLGSVHPTAPAVETDTAPAAHARLIPPSSND